MENRDIAFSGPTLFKPSYPAPKRDARLVWLIAGSILIHVIVLATLSFPPPRQDPQKESPIRAVLYIPKPVQAAPDEPTEPILPEPVYPAEAAIPEETAEHEPSTIDEILPEPDTQKDNGETTPTPEAVEQPTSESVPVEGEILTQAKDSPAPSSKRITTAISKGIAGQQLQKQYEMAEEAARQRRAEIKSPDLHVGEYSQPEKTIGEYKINCDKGINSTLAFIAGRFGGKITCDERNEFQQFIDKRQHKQTQQ